MSPEEHQKVQVIKILNGNKIKTVEITELKTITNKVIKDKMMIL